MGVKGKNKTKFASDIDVFGAEKPKSKSIWPTLKTSKKNKGNWLLFLIITSLFWKFIENDSEWISSDENVQNDLKYRHTLNIGWIF